MQYGETGVGYASLAHRSIGYVVYGLIDGCVGIKVGPELDAVAFAPVAYRVFTSIAVRKVACAVERHVLKEVSQPALLGLLEYRAYTLCNVEVSLPRSLVVVAYVVGKPVGELTFAYTTIERQRLRRHSHTAAQAHQKREDSSLFHIKRLSVKVGN